jgi:hypothetical protein
VDNDPLIVLRPSEVKVVLIPGRNQPLIVEPSQTTSVTIRRSDIPGSPGPEGPPGPQGPPGSTDLPDRIDGGSF